MNVSIYGMGYVGSVLAGCLSEHGHTVVGVDVNPQKVRRINEGETPVDEPGVDTLVSEGVESGNIEATTDSAAAAERTELSFITVGTPSDESGQLNTTNLYNVMDAVAPGIEGKPAHTFVVRSTVPPRTTRNLHAYLADQVDDPPAVEFFVNPEFLREGTAVEDFYHPPFVVIGTFDETEPTLLFDLYESMDINAPFEVVPPELAEAVKLVNNSFHALKICFANEVGSLFARWDVDGKALMDLVCKDRKLNISTAYLEPGFAFGGACLPKDSRAVAQLASRRDVSVPLLGTILTSNQTHLDRVTDAIDEFGVDRLGVVGLSFKAGTADMRNSPGLQLARSVESTPVLYTNNVDLANVIGSNRDYLDKTFPDVESHLIGDAREFLEAANAVVFTNDGTYAELFPTLCETTVFDPVGAVSDRADEIDDYRSVVW